MEHGQEDNSEQIPEESKSNLNKKIVDKVKKKSKKHKRKIPTRNTNMHNRSIRIRKK